MDVQDGGNEESRARLGRAQNRSSNWSATKEKCRKLVRLVQPLAFSRVKIYLSAASFQS